MRLLETGALAAVLTKGQPREAAIARLGRPNKVIIEKGATESYWLKVDVETYAGLSNRREYRTVDGQAQVSQTEGMKIKQHRRDCIIRITADAASIITTSEIIGDPASCGTVLGRPAP